MRISERPKLRARTVLVWALLGCLPWLAVALPRRADDAGPSPAGRAVRSWVDAKTASEPPASWGAAELELLVDLLTEARPGAPRSERILTAIGALAPKPVETWIGARVDERSKLDERVGALRVLGRFGSRQALSACLALAGREDQAARTGPELRNALAGILARHPEAQEHLWALLQESPAHLVTFVLEGVGDAPGILALSDLVDWLDRAPKVRATTLSVIARVASATCAPSREDDAVRRWLASDSPAIVACAARACGALQDAASVETLLELLDAEPSEVREAALEGLRSISGHRFCASRSRWESWYRTEDAWWRERSEDAFADLRAPARAPAARAIREIAGRSLDRPRLASELAGALEHPDAQVRALAAAGLAGLRSPAAVPALERAMEDESEVVQRAAEQALKSLQRAAAVTR